MAGGDSAEVDGGPGSGNFGHEGRPGEIGGSLPDGKSLSKSVNNAIDEGGEKQILSALKKAMKQMPVGASLTFNGVVQKKVSEDKWEKSNPFLGVLDDSATLDDIAYGIIETLEKDYAPDPYVSFDIPEAKEVAEEKVESGELDPADTSVPISVSAENKAKTSELKKKTSSDIKDAIAKEDTKGIVKVLTDAPDGANLILTQDAENMVIVKEGDKYHRIFKSDRVVREELTAEQVADWLNDTIYDLETAACDMENVSASGKGLQNSNPDADETSGVGLCEKKTHGSKVIAYQKLSDDEKVAFIKSAHDDVVVDPDYLNAVSGTQRISAALNNNEKPTVISQEEFEEAHSSGKPVLYRAVSSQTAVDSLMYGDETYLGDGLAGDGIYMSDNRDHILGGDGFGGKKMGLYFNDSAVIKSDREIEKEMANSRFSEDVAMSQYNLSKSDYCLLMGYDGFWTNNGADEKYYCIVKRDNLCVCQLEDDAT